MYKYFLIDVTNNFNDINTFPYYSGIPNYNKIDADILRNYSDQIW